MLDVSVDMKDFMALADVPKKVQAILKRDLKRINKAAEKQAMTQHRYRRRTGKLQYATRGYVKEFTSTIMVDGRIAPYGYFVHEGQRSWAADRFVTKAGDKMEKDIEVAVLKALDQALSGR